jgi:hypothetical protein
MKEMGLFVNRERMLMELEAKLVLHSIYLGHKIDRVPEKQRILIDLFRKGYIDGGFFKPAGFKREIFIESCITIKGLRELKNLGIIKAI